MFGKGPLDYIRLPKLDLDPDTKRSIFVVLIMVFGAISLLALLGMAGPSGVHLANGLAALLGWGKWFFPILLLGLGVIIHLESSARGATYLGAFLFIMSIEALFHMFLSSNKWETAIKTGAGGGYVGLSLAKGFTNLLGFWAALILLVSLFVISLLLTFNTTLTALFGRESWLARIFSFINFLYLKIMRRGRAEGDEQEEETEEETEEAEAPDEVEEEEVEESSYVEASEDEEPDEVVGKAGFSSRKITEEAAIMAAAAIKEPEKIWRQTHIKIDLPLDLLSDKIGKPTSGDIENNKQIIARTLDNFGIPVEMGAISVGPTVTQYTFKPAEGIKLSRITTLSNDLALSLAAHPIRIEAPIPGKSLVGVEVPNQTKATVGLREVLSTDDFKTRKNNLMIALGKDVAGKSWLYDLAKMPHLLVAGATNSGKSVCLNSIIVSLLYQNNPDDMRFIMVDPKRVELPVYNGIPHLLAPVITDVAKTINALKWCLNEMDRRFDQLAKVGKRNIESYNQNNRGERMPYIVFIIDELADLMVAAGRDIESGVIRLAQMARAVGIHLVLATQRPSVNIITGLIKANMPARIAFAVASGVDSRTILDSLGAEKLLGRGDMLFTSAEISKPRRLQGAFVSDNEIRKVVRYIKDKSGEPDYNTNITEKQTVKGMAAYGLSGNDEDNDDLLEQAKEIVINTGRASTSLLQRRLSVGYGRAAKMLDLLEAQGVIGPPNGSKPREIMIDQVQYEGMISQGVSGVSLHKREEAVAPGSYLDDEDAEDEEEDEEEEGAKSSFANPPAGEAGATEDKGEEEEQDEEEEEDAEREEEEEDQDEEENNEEEEEDDDMPDDEVARKPGKKANEDKILTKKEKGVTMNNKGNAVDLDEIYSEADIQDTAEELRKPKRTPQPGDDDFDKLFSR